MGITDYVAIYAALVVTVILIWAIWEHRKYVQFVAYINSEKRNVVIELHVTNKTKQPITIRYICFIDEDNSPYTFACRASPFWKNEPIIIGDETLETITLENESRCVFWLDINHIKQEFDEGYRYLFSHIAVINNVGKTYKHRIPKEIRNLLKD
jgi:hypothetical protein